MNIPAMGLGTYRLKGQAVIDSVRDALDVGYRAIDTAQIYENEADIGQAICDSGIARDALFLTTKIWIANFSGDQLISSLKASLEKLRTDRMDLTLIHWPSPGNEVPMAEYLGALAEARAQGLTRHIGVSNFTIDLLKQAVDLLGRDSIATNQVEISPYLQNQRLVDYAQAQGIHLTSYMTLAYGKVLQEPLLQDVALNHSATPAQVVLAWALEKGYSVIPSSTKRVNLEGNWKAQKLRLTDEEMKRVATLERGERLANPKGIVPDWD